MATPTNFLEMCQKAHELSGMSSGSRPSAVTGQTGYAAKIVENVNDAWLKLQGLYAAWRFMRVEITKTLTISTSLFDITAAPFSLTNFGSWDKTSFVLNTAGETDKSRVTWTEYDEFKQLYELSTFVSGRPTRWTQTTENKIQFNALTDKAYSFSARYTRTPSSMAANADVPTGLPVRFYMLIVYDALQTIAIDRGSNERLAEANFKSADMLGKLITAELELPPITKPAPLC